MAIDIISGRAVAEVRRPSAQKCVEPIAYAGPGPVVARYQEFSDLGLDPLHTYVTAPAFLGLLGLPSLRDLPDLDRLEEAGLLGKAPMPEELRAAGR
jgi:hypothetical protein